MKIPINIKEIINSDRGKYIISIILGLGLATLFRKACKSKNCLLFKAPPLDKIKNKVFDFDNRCYEFSEKSTSCSNLHNNILLELEDRENIIYKKK